ncbi:Cullin-domain-containing protein [Meredithblackwellia eburnea MCA 4105]
MSLGVPKVQRKTVKGGAGVVRAPKKHGEPDTKGLERLSDAIKQIQQHNASQLSFEEHYRYAYNLVLRKHGHTLYNKVAELVTAHLEKETTDNIVPAFPPSSSSASLTTTSASSSATANASANVQAAQAGQLFLDRIKAVWDDHTACMGKLRDVLKYMDKTYTGTNGVPPIWDLGLALFFHRVILFSTDPKPKSKQASSSTPTPRVGSTSSFANGISSSSSTAAPARVLPTSNSTTVAHHLINTLLTVIRIEREGEVVSRHSIQSTVEILSQLTDEGLVALPLTASVGIGAGAPAYNGSSGSSSGGVGSGAASLRSKPVMGEGPAGEQLSPYKTSFEAAFLKQTREFYTRESQALLIECDAPNYLIRIQRRLEEEALRAQSYLARSTEPLLTKLLEDVLINKHLTAILEHSASGLATLINDSRIEDLQRLYNLFGRVERGRPTLQSGISAWIVMIGKQINEGLLVVVEEDAPAPAAEPEEEDPKGKGKAKAKGGPDASMGAKTKAALGWVQNVLDLKDKFDTLLIEAFASDKSIEKSINDAFNTFVNQNHKSPEYISLFIDENLKKGLKGKSEAEVDEVLNKTIALFRFLTEKDAFERYYNSHLAKRLISQRSVSDDAERNMLAKFRIEAGAAFTKSAEGMMKDVKTSEDAIAEYKRHQDRATDKAPFDMVPIICGQNNWPFSNIDRLCNLPDVLLKGVAAYSAFYNTKHSGRKLTFRPELGNVEVRVKFDARSHELTVSTHAMVVLALFEGLAKEETLSYNDVERTTNMAPAELKRTLQSLACAKYKILTKVPKGRDINDDDVFFFNSAFTCPLAKIRIQTVVNKVETAEERKETEGKVEEERRSLYDACIVRVMKDRKQMLHQELVSEVIKQLSSRFKPSPPPIKQSIERLIEKEYLERDDTDRRKLRYLA